MLGPLRERSFNPRLHPKMRRAPPATCRSHLIPASDQSSSCRQIETGQLSSSTAASIEFPCASECNRYSPPLTTLGTLNMHRSSVPASLFLKLPAIMLHSSPSASPTSAAFSAVPPNINFAMWPAVSGPQHTVTTPHKAPASPTMAVNPLSTFCPERSTGVTWQPSMISKTSAVARFRIGSQLSSRDDLENAVSGVMGPSPSVETSNQLSS